MVPDEYLELIHAELDGRLTDPQRADLSRYLLENPEARKLRDELRKLNAALEQIAPVEPPAGLRESILESVKLPPAVAAPRRVWAAPASFRYAAAFAGGALVTALAFQVASDQSAGQHTSQLVGTMSPPHPAVTVPLQQGQGSASARETPSGLVLEYDLPAGEPVRIVTKVTAPESADSPQVEVELYTDGQLIERQSLGVGSSD
jgi:anti-sigma factor RsiW